MLSIKILIVSTHEVLASKILRCLGLMQMKATVISFGNYSSAARLSKYCEKYISCPLSNFPKTDFITNISEHTEKIVNIINDSCEEEKFDLVIPAGILSTFLLSDIKNKITQAKLFPLSTAENINLMNDKWLFFNFLKEYNLPTPNTYLINSVKELEDLPITYPIVVKPLNLSGGMGVKICDSLSAIHQHISGGEKSSQLPLLLQEYIVGMDVDLNILADKGKVIAWTVQKSTRYSWEFFRDEKILEIGQKIVSASNYTGVAHVDMRYDFKNSCIQVIESNPRLWWSLQASALHGVNFVELGIWLAMSNQLPTHLQTEVISNEAEVIFPPYPRKAISGLIRGYFSPNDLKANKTIFLQSIHEYMPLIYDDLWNKFALRA